MGFPAAEGSLGCPSLPLGSWWGEASVWDQCWFPHCSLWEVQDDRVARREDHSVARDGRGHWVLGPVHEGSQCRSHTLVLVSHTSVHTCTPHTHTHPILLSIWRPAGSDTRPLCLHTWSQSKSKSCCEGWGVRDGYSTKSENSTITRIPAQSRSTCCRECHGSSSSKRSGSTFTRAM